MMLGPLIIVLANNAITRSIKEGPCDSHVQIFRFAR